MDPILLLVLMLVLLALPIWQTIKQNKQLRQIREMQSRLEPGAEVVTGSGIHGIVFATSDTTVDLTIADGVVTRWERASIARNLSEGTGADFADRARRGADPALSTTPTDDAEEARSVADSEAVPNTVPTPEVKPEVETELRDVEKP